MSIYTKWYRDGTVSVSSGSKIVIGTNTFWTTAGIHEGDIFKLNNADYEVDKVTDDTHITLTTAVQGVSGGNHAYAVIRNFNGTTNAELAARTVDLIGKFIKYIDTDMQTITGKSAYELAKENGYTGTLAQWLESLKDTAEITRLSADVEDLDARTDILAIKGAGVHNSIYRGRNLGSAVTPAQMAAIRAGDFSNFWIGDFWKIGGNYYMIAHFNYFNNLQTGNAAGDGSSENPLVSKPHVVLLLSPGYLYDSTKTQINARWNSSGNAVPEGGYFASGLFGAYEDNGAAMKQIAADLGADNLQQFRITACSSFKDGVCKAYSSRLVKACPPTERQLFGENIHSIEERDPYNERVFAVSLIAPHYSSGTWGMKALREIAGANEVCSNHYGRSGIVSPSDTNGSELQFMCVLG